MAARPLLRMPLASRSSRGVSDISVGNVRVAPRCDESVQVEWVGPVDSYGFFKREIFGWLEIQSSACFDLSCFEASFNLPDMRLVAKSMSSCSELSKKTLLHHLRSLINCTGAPALSLSIFSDSQAILRLPWECNLVGCYSKQVLPPKRK